MKKIYSPLLESLLALYLGFEWIQVCFSVQILNMISLAWTNIFSYILAPAIAD
jgi:hypothetical protein